MPKKRVPMGTMFGYNRVLKLKDYDDFGVQYRKQWEVHMALKTLRDFGAVHPDAEILGVGAGREQTTFELSTQVKRVFATDIYLDAGVWEDWHGKAFMIAPNTFAPMNTPFEIKRIVVQHADMRSIPHPDDSFDGVFSSGSIEHVGKEGIADYDAISQAAREIGRVTKPGGIISLSTEWKLSGEGWGWANVRVFDADTIMRVIVEPSGCELVDEPDWSYDGNLDDALELGEAIRNPASQIGAAALREHGYVFTSVHLALRKMAG